jgi:glyoxylase-like metal-dependent hydrolase (beta-lactamase superfamily II)
MRPNPEPVFSGQAQQVFTSVIDRRLLIFALLSLCLSACGTNGGDDPPQQTSSVSHRIAKKDLWRGSGYEPTSVDMALIKLSEHCYYVKGTPGSATEHEGFISNAGVVVTEDGVVVFDALGSPSLGYLLLNRIRELTDKPVVRVITSHYHADHIYGLQVFKHQGVQIWAPRGAELYLRSDAAKNRLNERKESLFPWVDGNTRIVAPDVYISHKQQFSLGGVNFTITPLGSTHSQGDLMLMVDSDGVMYSGDLIFQGRLPFVAGDTSVWIRQLHNLDTSRINVIVPGHGKAYKNPAQAVSFTLGYLQYVTDKMQGAVDELTPFDEVYSRTDWSRYKNMPAFIANRPNAYHIYLDLEKKSFQ